MDIDFTMSFFYEKKAANHARLATFSAFNNSLRIIVTNIVFIIIIVA